MCFFSSIFAIFLFYFDVIYTSLIVSFESAVENGDQIYDQDVGLTVYTVFNYDINNIIKERITGIYACIGHIPNITDPQFFEPIAERMMTFCPNVIHTFECKIAKSYD